MTVYAHGPKLNDGTGMAIHACFYFRVKKENSTKKKKRARWHMLFNKLQISMQNSLPKS